MRFRTASLADVPLLARMNRHLREDERSRYLLSPSDLEARMRRLLEKEGYTAILFEIEDEAVAYALYREVEGGIHLRQFFVSRDHRRRGIGREAMQLLFTRIWPPQSRITVDVLVHNQQGTAFWRALGFADYAVTLERFNSA